MPQRKIQRTEEAQKEHEESMRQKRKKYQHEYYLQHKQQKTQNSLETTLNSNLTVPSSSKQSQPSIKQSKSLKNDIENSTTTKNCDRRNSAASTKGFVDAKLHDRDVNDITEHYIGPMNISCKHCNAMHFISETLKVNKNNEMSFNDCCRHGKAYLDPLPDPPEYLKSLFNGSHPDSLNFRLCIPHNLNYLNIQSKN